jgi:hypothetical protein
VDCVTVGARRCSTPAILPPRCAPQLDHGVAEFAIDLLNHGKLAGVHLLSLLVSFPDGLRRLQALVCGAATPLEHNFSGMLLHELERPGVPAHDAGALLALLAAVVAGGAVPVGAHGRDTVVLGVVTRAARYPADRRCAAAMCRALAAAGEGCSSALAATLQEEGALGKVVAALRALRGRRDGPEYALACGAVTALARWAPFGAPAFAPPIQTAQVVEVLVFGAWLRRGELGCMASAVRALGEVLAVAPAAVHAVATDAAIALPLVAMAGPRGTPDELHVVLSAMQVTSDLLAGRARGPNPRGLSETLRCLTPLVPWAGVLREMPGNEHALILTGSLIGRLDGSQATVVAPSLTSFVGFADFIAAFIDSAAAASGVIAGVMVLWGMYVLTCDADALAAALATPHAAEAWVRAIVRHVAYLEPEAPHDAEKVKHGVLAAKRAADVSGVVRAALCGRGVALGRAGGGDKDAKNGGGDDGAAGPIIAAVLRHRRDSAIVDAATTLSRSLTKRGSDEPSASVDTTAAFSVRFGAVAAFTEVAGAALVAGLLGDGPPPPPSVLSDDAMECLLFAAARCAESAPEAMSDQSIPAAVLRLIESRGAVFDLYGPPFFAAVAECEEGRRAVARMRSRLGAIAGRARGTGKGAVKGVAEAYDAVIATAKGGAGGSGAPPKRVIYM